MKYVEAGVLRVAYEEHGDPSGSPVVLLHGFPYDVRAYDEVAPRVAAAGARVLIPYLRGYGPTQFLDSSTLRSGQQAALATDLHSFMDALGLSRTVLAGFDWGGRAACIVSALWPERVTGLVTQNGYNVQDIAHSGQPARPENEWRHWYQYYFHGERGRAGLAANRQELCRLLWRLWSPKWDFDDATYARTAQSFDNPDFVDVVIHSYRHRFALAGGDPSLEEIEKRIAMLPEISVPTIHLDGLDDGVSAVGGTAAPAGHFTGPYEFRAVSDAGHNVPQEAPEAFAEAVIDTM
ncbi:MAG: alpha/beta hydrolase [Chloroflexota bacterium]